MCHMLLRALKTDVSWLSLDTIIVSRPSGLSSFEFESGISNALVMVIHVKKAGRLLPARSSPGQLWRILTHIYFLQCIPVSFIPDLDYHSYVMYIVNPGAVSEKPGLSKITSLPLSLSHVIKKLWLTSTPPIEIGTSLHKPSKAIW